MITLDDTSFCVAATAQDGVVDASTRLHFAQRGQRVLGRYCGGAIRRGYLVGTLVGDSLRFRYAQTEADGHVHGGRSACDLEVLPDGRLRVHEHFVWETRSGNGTNILEQVLT